MLDKRTLRLAVLLLVFAPGPAAAQVYPTRPVKMVVPFRRAVRSMSAPGFSVNTCHVRSDSPS
jgi:hypothetical protein